MNGRNFKCALSSLFVVFGFLLSQSAMAQNTDAGQTAPAADAAALSEQAFSAEEIDALVKRVEEQIERMNQTSSERDQALRFLEEQIEKATNQISAKEETESALRQKTLELGSEIEILSKDREDLNSETETQGETMARLAGEVSKLEQMLAAETSLRENMVSDFEDRFAREQGKTAAAADETTILKQRLSNEEEHFRQQIASLQEQEKATRAELGISTQEINRLNRNITMLVGKLSSVQQALGQSELTISSQGVRIEDLNARLTEALQAQVEELEQYRSDFFGALRRILGDSRDIVVVGDRFVLPANLFFASGSALLSAEARQKLGEIAVTLERLSSSIPSDIHWILRVDGHTDDQPLRPGAFFQSNWELSSARSIAVVKFLIESGIAPRRLAATGFGEFQPIDPVNKNKNRRIEFKLTEG